MPRNNHIDLHGKLAIDPYFETLGDAAYIRFDLLVERDRSQLPVGGRPSTAPPNDLLRVVEYGLRAELDFQYLKKGALVAVSGWLESRRYFDVKAGGNGRDKGRWRRVHEVNAQRITFGRGCDFERGDEYRARRVARAEAEGIPLPPELIDHALELSLGSALDEP